MKKFKWTIELEVDETWVADGFDPDNDDVTEMLARRLPWAYGHEFKARVITRPTDADVAKAQGYPTVTAYRRDRK